MAPAVPGRRAGRGAAGADGSASARRSRAGRRSRSPAAHRRRAADGGASAASRLRAGSARSLAAPTGAVGRAVGADTGTARSGMVADRGGRNGGGNASSGDALAARLAYAQSARPEPAKHFSPHFGLASAGAGTPCRAAADNDGPACRYAPESSHLACPDRAEADGIQKAGKNDCPDERGCAARACRPAIAFFRLRPLCLARTACWAADCPEEACASPRRQAGHAAVITLFRGDGLVSNDNSGRASSPP